MEKRCLEYDAERWEELPKEPVNTLQLFITNRCNLRCGGCFNSHNLGKGDMALDEYETHVRQHADSIKKVVILGGEPTLHPDLPEMIRLNQSLSLKTTIYTNGFKIKRLEEACLEGVAVRVGVYGAERSERPLASVPATGIPLTVVYMLRKDNIDELMHAAYAAEMRFNCRDFYISSIRDIASTHDFWKDNEGTISNQDFFSIVQAFVSQYHGQLNLHIAKRGVIKSGYESEASRCRFGNIFPNGKKITCPLDIALEKYCEGIKFRENKCNKDELCVLRKVVLRNKNGIGADFDGVISHALTGNSINLGKMQALEGRFGFNGRQGCDTLEGPCSCGAWHKMGEKTTLFGKDGKWHWVWQERH